MTLNYLQLIHQESQTAKQLNYLDQLIQSNHYNLHEEYPQLFHNEDSLFKPDDMYGDDMGKGNAKDSKGKDREIYRDRKQKEEKIEKSREIFQEYLDSLDINQFLHMQRTYGSKSNKNLESSLQCTFKPSILKKSNEIAQSLKPSFQRLTMQVRNPNKKIPYKPVPKEMQKHYSRERIQRLSKPRILKTQPSQHIQYRKIETEKKYFIPRSSNYMDVATRNQVWEEQKQIKIEKMRKQQEELRQKKERSTFVPKLTEYRGEKTANLSNFAKQGMANYFERLHVAKSKNNTYTGKQNNNSFRKESSPYCSNNASKTPKKHSIQIKKVPQKVKYDDAVKQLHKKLMSLNI